jgi:hypothetical protein
LIGNRIPFKTFDIRCVSLRMKRRGLQNRLDHLIETSRKCCLSFLQLHLENVSYCFL